MLEHTLFPEQHTARCVGPSSSAIGDQRCAKRYWPRLFLYSARLVQKTKHATAWAARSWAQALARSSETMSVTATAMARRARLSARRLALLLAPMPAVFKTAAAAAMSTTTNIAMNAPAAITSRIRGQDNIITTT